MYLRERYTTMAKKERSGNQTIRSVVPPMCIILEHGLTAFRESYGELK